MSIDSLMAGGQAASGLAQLGGGIYGAVAGMNYARLVRQAGEFEARLASREAVKLEGAQRAAFAASGINPNRGSAVRVILQSQIEEAWRRELIRFNADVAAERHESEAVMSALVGVAGAASAGIQAGAFYLDKPKKGLQLTNFQSAPQGFPKAPFVLGPGS